MERTLQGYENGSKYDLNEISIFLYREKVRDILVS